MKQQYSKLLIVVFLILSAPQAFAQLKGVITDSISHEPLMYISVFYEGKGVGGISNANGEYQVETRKGWNELTFSAVGYITKKVKIPAGAKELNVVLSPDDVMLDEVVIKPKKEKYSRKNNPAVEFMRKVIDHKKAQKLETNDYYQYNKYQKISFALNDIKPEDLTTGKFKNKSYVKDQIETSPYNGKLILPVSVDETVTQHIYR